MLSRCFLDFSVGEWAFAIGLSRSLFFLFMKGSVYTNNQVVTVPLNILHVQKHKDLVF